MPRRLDLDSISPLVRAVLALAATVLAVTVLALILGCGPSLEPLAEPQNLQSADGSVRDQYQALRQQLDELPSGVPAAQRAEAFGRLGMWFHAYRLQEGAETAYGNSLELLPGAPQWSYLRGILFSQQGRIDEAARDFAAAAKSGQPAARTRWAETQLKLGQTETAVETLQAIVTADGSNVRALVALANGRELQGQKQVAAELLEEALQRQGDASGARYQLGLLYRQMGEEERAAAHLALADPSEKPDRLRMVDPWFRELRGMDVSYLGSLQKAREEVARGRHAEALGHFRVARKVDPSRFAAGFGEAKALTALDRDREALELCQELLGSFADQSGLHILLGRLYRRAGDPRAEEEVEKALELDPDSLPALRQLAALAEERGDLRRVVELLEHARKLAPSSTPILRSLAEAWIELGEKAKAEQMLHESLAVADEPWALRLLLERLGAESPDSGRDTRLPAPPDTD